MKIFLFLILLIIIPNVSAIAVTPAKLEFKVFSNDFQEKEFFIYNNNNHKTNYSIVSSDWFKFYPSNLIELNPRSNKKIKAILETNNAERGKYETKIYIKEIVNSKGLNFENNLAIRTFIDVLSGERKIQQQDEIKILKISDNVDEIEKVSKEIKNSNKDTYFFILLTIVLILAIANLIKRFK